MSHISGALRLQVKSRANGLCEYCRYDERYAMKTFECDHIIAEKHGGNTTLENLCFSCFDCNRYKGSDLCSYDEVESLIVTLYNPREMIWEKHFRLLNNRIEALTPQGRITTHLLRFNHPQQVEERALLNRMNR